MSKKNKEEKQEAKQQEPEVESQSPVPALIAAIKAAQIVVDRPTSEVPYSIKSGYEVIREQSRASVKEDKEKLLQLTVPNRLIGVFLDGDASKLAEVDLFVRESSIVMQGDYPFTIFTDAVELTYGQPVDDLPQNARYQPTFSTSQYIALTNEINRLASNFDVDGDIVSTLNLTPVVKRVDLRNAIANHILPLANKLLTAIYRADIVNQTITKKLTNDRVPVFVLNTPDPRVKELIEGLFARTASEILDPSFTVNKENIVEIIKKAK